MEDRLLVTASPHIRDHSTTRGLMGNVVIALLPAVLASALIFGARALLLVVVTTFACVAFEYIYERLLHKTNTVGDLSAVVTGIILALNMPVGMPIWIAVVGAFVAIVITKQLFGGLGCCQLSVAAGSQYGGVQAVRHSGQSRAFKCGVKWEIHKSHHAVVGFHHFGRFNKYGSTAGGLIMHNTSDLSFKGRSDGNNQSAVSHGRSYVFINNPF